MVWTTISNYDDVYLDIRQPQPAHHTTILFTTGASSTAPPFTSYNTGESVYLVSSPNPTFKKSTLRENGFYGYGMECYDGCVLLFCLQCIASG